MPLRIRKEVQDELKASLDGAPAAMPAPGRSPLPVDPPQEAAEVSVAPLTTDEQPLRRKARRPRASAAAGAKPVRKRTSGKAAPRKRRAGTAVGFRDYTGEIETIRTLFDLLIMSAAEPGQLTALKSLTERYLTVEPSEAKLAQVRSILQRQAAIVRGQREAGIAPARLAIEATAVTVDEPALADPPPPSPAESPQQPEPDRLRRGEVGQAPPPADKAETPLPAHAPRRTILSWLRRGGGSGGGAGGGASGSGEPGRPLRAKLKTVLMASVWIGVGGVVMTYAGALVYVNWMRLEIDSALISGNIEPVNAPFDGSITAMLVKAGDKIVEGQRFVVMEDPEVEKLVKLMSVKVERAREDLRLKQAELDSEKSKRDEYISISRNKMEKIESDIEALESLEKVARERFMRLRDLFKKGIVIRPRLEEASDKLAELTTQLNKAKVNRKERTSQFEGVLAGHFYDGNQVVGRLKEAEAAVVRAAAEVDLALEELQVMQQRRHINRITAAHDSRVLKVLRNEGSSVKRGDTMMFVERSDERVVHAFLRQEEVNRIAIGDEATIYVPSLRAKATARVMKVDRNAAFLDDVDSRYTWKTARDSGPKATDKDRTARVTLQFEGPEKEIVETKFEIGTPTVVSFPRRSVNTVFSSFVDVGRKL